MSEKRTAPKSIRFTDELNTLIDKALRKAGIKKTAYGWFPALLTVLLNNYLKAS